jgi:ribulose-5-phosphate 4-epimerase/fuculose-1-phosphate aldolase/putative sterol carrier protein
MENNINSLKKSLIETGKLIWDKNLVCARSGNISCRVDEKSFLLTCHDGCFGFLTDKDFALVDLEGKVLRGENPSTEAKMHAAIYRQLPKVRAVIHTHTTYINSYFSANEVFEPFTFETRLYVGSVTAIPQTTPTVTDIAPVVESLNKNNIAVLKNHGVVVAGDNLQDGFFLIQTLEEAIKMESLRRIFSGNSAGENQKPKVDAQKKFKLFSPEHIEHIVGLVNQDAQIEKLGKELKVTLTMAVKMDDTRDTFRFNFQDGKITAVSREENAEFVISGSEKVWRQIFNREIDPFVATTQRKLNLKGDFAKLSRWYAPFSRIFELWNQVPVE